MDILKIPTDSLYKFFAITGIIMIIMPSVFLDNEVQELILESYNLKIESEILGIERDYLIEETTLLKEQIDILESDELNPEKERELLDETKRLRELTKQAEIKIVEIENKLELHSILGDRLKILLRELRILIIAGIILMFFGFYFWYIRVQVYQDGLIKHQYRLIKKQSDK